MDCSKPSNVVATAWVSMITSAKLMTKSGKIQVLHNQRRHAMCSLRESIDEVQRCESDTSAVLRNIALEVKSAKSKGKGAMRDLLTNSRAQRQKLQVISRKRVSLQQHLETLETSELNQQVITSVKETSDVLKNMGLAQNVESVDELMLDMAESQDDVRQIQTGLAAGHDDDADAAELDAELALLLGEDGDSAAPPHNNTMHEPALVAPHAAAESPRKTADKKKAADKKKGREQTVLPAVAEEPVLPAVLLDEAL